MKSDVVHVAEVWTLISVLPLYRTLHNLLHFPQYVVIASDHAKTRTRVGALYIKRFYLILLREPNGCKRIEKIFKYT